LRIGWLISAGQCKRHGEDAAAGIRQHAHQFLFHRQETRQDRYGR
jgi:hypothetical protein